MKIIERIYVLLKERGKTAYALCQELNITTSTMSSWKVRGNDPPARYMKTIANFLEVSLDYLLTGKEAPPDGGFAPQEETSPEEDELLRLFRMLPDKYKSRFIEELKVYVKAAYVDMHEFIDEEKKLSV